MRLLIVTQAVDADSSTLGFFIEWLKEFARGCEQVDVIAFKSGRYDLPQNVRVHDVRRNDDDGPLRRLLRYRSLLKALAPKVDAVFIHMSPEYLIASWPILRSRPTALWYLHRKVSWRLRLAAAITDRIITATETSCRLKTNKKSVVGHGIPTTVLAMTSRPDQPRLITVGRITPIKRLELMIEALEIVRTKGLPATLDVYGETVRGHDRSYAAKLSELIGKKGLEEAIIFKGAVRYDDMPGLYGQYSLSLNMAPTGAPDKAVLEAMSCGVPVLVSNANFRPILGSDAGSCVTDAEPQAIAQGIEGLLRNPDASMGKRLRAVVERDHSLNKLIERILKVLDINGA